MSLIDKFKSLFDKPSNPPACTNCVYFYHKRNETCTKVNPPKGWCTRNKYFDPVEGEYKIKYIDATIERSTGDCGIGGRFFIPYKYKEEEPILLK